MEQNYERIGRLKEDPDIEIVRIDGHVYALNGWNGEAYLKCWRGEEPYSPHPVILQPVSDEVYEITPVYEQIDEDEYIIVGYDVR
jgi:hypothetical protein